MSGASAGNARQRILESDVLRVAAVVGVAMIHASAWAPGGGGSNNTVFGAISDVSRFSVPVFMVLTGFALGYQYRDRPLGAGFVSRRAARTIVPWLIWAPIFLLFDVFVVAGTSRDPGSTWSWAIGGTGHLWFLLLVPQLYVLFAVWPRRNAWLLVAPALALQTLLCVARVYGLFVSGLQHFAIAYGFELFPFWIGYFAIGVAIGQGLRPGTTVKHRPVLLAASGLAVVAGAYLLLNVNYSGAPWAAYVRGTGAFEDPILPVLVLAVFAFVWLVSSPMLRRSAGLRPWVRELSELSLGTYIIHPIPLFFLGTLVQPYLSGGTPLAFLPLSAITLGALVGAAVATRLIAATPLAYSVGLRPKPLHLARIFSTARTAPAADT
jgi:probable poly-beta-1,6-N-acetyl-D-glucosamine export protein